VNSVIGCLSSLKAPGTLRPTLWSYHITKVARVGEI
jgi:hypothetical protein